MPHGPKASSSDGMAFMRASVPVPLSAAALTGACERLFDRAHGEVDPTHPVNVIIQDIALAPPNARGMLEYSTDVEILRLADRNRGNRVRFRTVCHPAQHAC